MSPKKTIDLENFNLSTGAHSKSLDDGGESACIMEMVSYMADEPWSDHPKCACPILTEYSIRLNDRFNDEHRQRMKEFIPLLIGTRETDEVQIRRKRLIRWRNVTATYPLVLEAIKLPELAAELRAFQNNLESMAESYKFLQKHKEEIQKAGRKIAYADANAYADAYAYADANAYAYAYAYAYADAYADAYAYAYADANADADANAWRTKVADVALETLRLAIAVTDKT